jgi:hypothetical protein
MRRTMTGAFRVIGRAGLILVAGIVAVSSSTSPTLACGAYFAKRLPTTTALAGSQLYNRTTKMVVARVHNAITAVMRESLRP